MGTDTKLCTHTVQTPAKLRYKAKSASDFVSNKEEEGGC